MLNTGKQTSQFFDSVDVWNPHLTQNEKKYRLKTLEQYSREHNTNEQPGKQYFKATTLPGIINLTPMPTTKSSRQGHELDKGNVTWADPFPLLMCFLRVEQSSSFYWFLSGSTEFKSCYTMDSSAGKIAPVYHGREVYETFCGSKFFPFYWFLLTTELA